MEDSGLEPDRWTERLRHRRDLALSRAGALRRLHRRVRAAIGLCAVLGTGLVAVPFIAGGQLPLNGAKVFDALIARKASFGDLVVEGTIRVVDSRGREIAFLGREGDDAGGASVLTLTSTTQAAGVTPSPALRLAASEAGSAVALDEPRGDAGVALIASRAGPRVEIRQGHQRRVLGVVAEPSQHISRSLPAVAAAAPAPGSSIALNASPTRVWDIGSGFFVAELRSEDVPEGLVVAGRVVNATSLKQTDVHFLLAASDQSVPLRIGIISPGNSTGFRVVLPSARQAEVETLRFEFQHSTVRYAAHSMRAHRALRQR